MSPILREYLLKGVFLGLWSYLALILPPQAPDWSRFLAILSFAAGGLAIGLILGAVWQIRRGFKPSANPKAFPLIVLLESPYWIYGGLIAGLAVGLVAMVTVISEEPVTGWLAYFVVGGAILGSASTNSRRSAIGSGGSSSAPSSGRRSSISPSTTSNSSPD